MSERLYARLAQTVILVFVAFGMVYGEPESPAAACNPAVSTQECVR